MHIKFSSENMKVTEHMGDVVIDRTISVVLSNKDLKVITN
jgi:hypothetical protein